MNRRKRFIEWITRNPAIGLPVVVIFMLLVAVTLQAVAVIGYQDYQVISTPGNPASGYLRFFATTGTLNCLTSSGGSCFPSGGPTSQNDETSSRALSSSSSGPGHVYQNTTGKPIWVTISVYQAANVSEPSTMVAYTDSSATPTSVVAYSNIGSTAVNTDGWASAVSFVVLNNNYYFLYAPAYGGSTPTLEKWIEWE